MKKNLLTVKLAISIIIICFVAVLVFFIAPLNNKNGNNKTDLLIEKNSLDEQLKNEAEALKEINKELISNIMAGANQQDSNLIKKVNETDHILGKINAPVQMIVYNNYDCSFCLDFYETTKQIIKEFGDEIVIAYRHYPLSIHSSSIQAAIASECAAEQGKFIEMHDKLFADKKSGKMSLAQFKQDAVDINLDATKFNQCLEEEKYKDKVDEQLKLGKEAGAVGVPTIFVNGQQLPGAYPFDDFTRENGEEIEGMKSVITRHLEQSK